MLRTLQRQLRDARRDPASEGPHRPSSSEGASPADEAPSRGLAVEPASPALVEKLEAVRAGDPVLGASLAQLDPAQLAAVLSDDRSVLVRAAVGSGKTRVLVHRVLYLHRVRGVPLRKMAVLTFTNRAADEIRGRLLAMSRGTEALVPDDLRLTGTFHGVARTLLASALPVERTGYRSDFAVLDDDACEDRLDRLIAAHHLRIRRRRHLRARLRAPQPSARAPDDTAILATLYADDKRAANAMDYDDLIDHAAALLDGGGRASEALAHHVVVDEMQDCEPRELLFLRRLGRPGAGFFGVGDPHQAIYGWRGSDPEVFSRAEVELGCKVYSLPVSYRSTRTIVEGARAVLGLQPERGADLQSAREPGAPIALRRHHDPVSEALYLADRIARLHDEGLAYREVAVLFRLRAQAEVLRASLSANGVPTAGPDDPPSDAVRLLTLHGAKGLEFRRVFLSGVNDGLVPLSRRRTAAEDAEERRLLFVGMTRASDAVEISYHAQPHEAGVAGEISPYLTFVPAALLDWNGTVTPRCEDAPVPAAPAPKSPPVEVAAVAVDDASPYRPGQAVRHARYGAGIVVRLAEGVVECDFGKRGARSFPLALCPLTSP
jgi:superfamily I DNA/RNA helicase